MEVDFVVLFGVAKCGQSFGLIFNFYSGRSFEVLFEVDYSGIAGHPPQHNAPKETTGTESASPTARRKCGTSSTCQDKELAL